ncbi:MAG: hypothetical protein AAFW84_03895 [Cyanobacteria bacterium J06635_15]
MIELTLHPCGEVAIIAVVSQRDNPESVDCDAESVCGPFADANCWRYIDLNSGEPYILAFEGVCI